jgi:hypothetical protein
MNEACRSEPIEHLGDGRRREVGGARELARRQLAALREAEQKAVLRVAQLTGVVRLPAAKPAHRRHRGLE